MGKREIFGSWKEIGDYLKRDVRTCQRYERKLGLPVRRLDESARARIFAFKDEIDAWRVTKLREGRGALPRLLYFVKSKPLAAVLAVVLILGLGALIRLFVLSLSGDKGSRSGLSIAVLPVQSASERDDATDWTRGIPVLLINGLSGSTYFEALSYDRTLGALKDMNLEPAAGYSADDLKEFAEKSGATHVITCVVVKAGNGRVAALTALRPGTGEAYASRYEIEDEAGIVRSVDRMVDQIKRDLGLTRTTQAGDFDALGVPVTTSSLEAFRLYNEGRRLHLAGELASSIQSMRKALRHDPEFALAWRSLSASLSSQGAVEEAAECIEKALEFSRNASTQERFYIRADYFHSRRDLGKALQAALEWTSIFPDNTHALMFAGRAYLFMEAGENARGFLEAALSKGDTNPYTFFFAALASTTAGKYEVAARICDRGLSILPGNSTIVWARIMNELALGHLDRALRDAERAGAARPESAFNLLAGDILLLKDDFAGAEAQYRKTRLFSPEVLIRLARLALAEGRYGRAADLSARAGSRVLSAYIEARRGRLARGSEEADKALDDARKRDNSLAELTALQMKVMIETLRGNLEAAEALAAPFKDDGRRSLMKPQERAARFIEGLIESAAGRPDTAAERFSAAVALLPLDIAYIDNSPQALGLGSSLHAFYMYHGARENERAGHAGAARELYEHLIGLRGGRLQYPDLFALSHYAVGRIKEAQGDVEGALEGYDKFLDLWKNADPGIPEVEEARARLADLAPAR